MTRDKLTLKRATISPETPRVVLPPDQVEALRERLRQALSTTLKTVHEVMRDSGVDFISPARVNWHLIRVQGAQWEITPDGLRWRLETKTDRNDNFTFYLE